MKQVTKAIKILTKKIIKCKNQEKLSFLRDKMETLMNIKERVK